MPLLRSNISSCLSTGSAARRLSVSGRRGAVGVAVHFLRVFFKLGEPVAVEEAPAPKGVEQLANLELEFGDGVVIVAVVADDDDALAHVGVLEGEEGPDFGVEVFQRPSRPAVVEREPELAGGLGPLDLEVVVDVDAPAVHEVVDEVAGLVLDRREIPAKDLLTKPAQLRLARKVTWGRRAILIASSLAVDEEAAVADVVDDGIRILMIPH
mmetsp:Transcript_16685/g.54326  ORF Transcript_16685/g.54326 Transcript_16685/m.54326 type:complete len:211 (-) Transcript_16685:989-1621(-)